MTTAIRFERAVHGADCVIESLSRESGRTTRNELAVIGRIRVHPAVRSEWGPSGTQSPSPGLVKRAPRAVARWISPPVQQCCTEAQSIARQRVGPRFTRAGPATESPRGHHVDLLLDAPDPPDRPRVHCGWRVRIHGSRSMTSHIHALHAPKRMRSSHRCLLPPIGVAWSSPGHAYGESHTRQGRSLSVGRPRARTTGRR